MLEQEHPFLFGEESNCHSLFDMSIGSPAAEGSRSRSAGRIPLIISAETVTQSALTGISERTPTTGTSVGLACGGIVIGKCRGGGIGEF